MLKVRMNEFCSPEWRSEKDYGMKGEALRECIFQKSGQTVHKIDTAADDRNPFCAFYSADNLCPQALMEYCHPGDRKALGLELRLVVPV